MKQMLAILAALGAISCAFAEKQPFERYRTIIDRMPFGQPPPGFDPTRDPSEVSRDEYSQSEVELTQEQEAIQRAVRFSVINVESDGVVRVGFSDMTDPKAPRHFYLAVGESRGGWSVKDADPNEKKMTVVKDGVEVELGLGENSGGIDGKAVANARNSTKQARSSLLQRGGDSSTGAPMSLRGRREKREAEEAARRAEDAKMAAERERERAEREKREEEERAEREAERAEQREQLNALQEELRRQREEAKAARERGESSDDDEDEDSSDE